MLFDFFGFELIAIFVVLGLGYLIWQIVKQVRSDKKVDVLYWKKFALSLAIILMIPIVIDFGLKTFYPTPLYNDYVKAESLGTLAYTNKWNLTAEQKATPEYAIFVEQEEAYNDAVDEHRDISFAIMMLLGVSAVVGGLFLKIPAAGTGLMYGGVFTIIPSYFNYFEYLSDPMIFVSALIVLAALIYFAWKKFGLQEEPSPSSSLLISNDEE